MNSSSGLIRTSVAPSPTGETAIPFALSANVDTRVSSGFHFWGGVLLLVFASGGLCAISSETIRPRNPISQVARSYLFDFPLAVDGAVALDELSFALRRVKLPEQEHESAERGGKTSTDEYDRKLSKSYYGIRRGYATAADLYATLEFGRDSNLIIPSIQLEGCATLTRGEGARSPTRWDQLALKTRISK